MNIGFIGLGNMATAMMGGILNKGIVSAEEIYERVWEERAINTETVMVHVRHIREKIEYNPKEPKYLKVVWGVGYKIEKNT